MRLLSDEPEIEANAGAFGLPVLHLDMSCVFGGIVGQSEAKLRSVIQTCEVISQCVLWVDEIEKNFSGSKSSGSSDGGTSSQLLVSNATGLLLTKYD